MLYSAIIIGVCVFVGIMFTALIFQFVVGRSEDDGLVSRCCRKILGLMSPFGMATLYAFLAVLVLYVFGGTSLFWVIVFCSISLGLIAATQMTRKSADRLEESYPLLSWCVPLLAATFVAIALFGGRIEALEGRSNQLYEVQESVLDQVRKECNAAQNQVIKLQTELNELTEFNVRLQASIAYFSQKYTEMRRESENLREHQGGGLQEPSQGEVSQEETARLHAEERLRMNQTAMAIWQHNQKYPLPPGYVWVYIQDPALTDNNNSPILNREHNMPLGVPGSSVRR